jgi:hypothetical protein
MDFATLVSAITGDVPVSVCSDNASTNNKFLTDNQKYPQQYSGNQHNDEKLPTDRRYDCFGKHPYYSFETLLGTLLWIPFFFYLMDCVHVVYKTPRNHLLYKLMALWSRRKQKLIL